MKVTDEPVKAPTLSQSGLLPNREIVEPVASQAKGGQAGDVGLPASHAESSEDHTQSVLMAMLMHLPLIIFLFLLVGPAMEAVPELIFNLVFGATLWVLVAAVAAADRRKLSLIT